MTFTDSVPIVVLVLALLLLVGALYMMNKSADGRFSLTRDEVAILSRQADAAKSEQEKTGLIFEMHRRHLRHLKDQEITLEGAISWKAFFVSLPLLLVLGTLVYVVRVCYPVNIFLWGDWEEHYSRLVSRRRTLWTVVIIGLFLGIIGNLFVASLSF